MVLPRKPECGDSSVMTIRKLETIFPNTSEFAGDVGATGALMLGCILWGLVQARRL